MRIREFTSETINVDEDNELNSKSDEISRKTPIYFAKEIENMDENIMLFLSFLFISDSFEKDFIKRNYEKLITELDIDDPNGFESVIEWFKEDKIDISKNEIRFSNPTYSEALEFLLNRKIFSKIFNNVLLFLANLKEALWDIVYSIIHNFKVLDENIQKKLIKLSQNHDAVEPIIYHLIPNFNKLDEDVGKEIVYNVIKFPKAPAILSSQLNTNFNSIPSV